ncbi:hypothetical protein WT24_17265 [Burkholderia sp. MSMB1078WGS]|nr:hypothetical protein WT24_17265 [Burkholderia sp. MSMB1078WGS]
MAFVPMTPNDSLSMTAFGTCTELSAPQRLLTGATTMRTKMSRATDSLISKRRLVMWRRLPVTRFGVSIMAMSSLTTTG